MCSTIEEMIENSSFWDTVLVCADGTMKVNRLTVGLLFPHLKSSEILQMPFENVVILPEFVLHTVHSLIAENLRKNMGCNTEHIVVDDIKKEVEVQEEDPIYNNNFHVDVKENLNSSEITENDSNDNSDEEYTPDHARKRARKKYSSFTVKLDDLKFDLEVANTKYETLLQNIRGASKKVVVDGVEKFECSVCKESVAKLNMSTHIARKHSDLDFKCPYCTFATGNFTLLKSHMGKHFIYSEEPHNIEKLECSVCFKKVINLKEHINLVHERKLIYDCPNCEKAFPNRSQLKKHIASHIGLKQACPLCGKEIAARHLKEHIREVHEKVKNHCCPECGMAFFARRALEKHMRTHTKEKTICAHCGKAVANIRSHMKVVHSDKDKHTEKVVRFSCPDCDFTCYKRDIFKTHLNVHAKGNHGNHHAIEFGETGDDRMGLKGIEDENYVADVPVELNYTEECSYKNEDFVLPIIGLHVQGE